MHVISDGPAFIAWLALALAFIVLAKGADYFVDSAVAVAARLHVPHLVIGIVLVSLATTTPELAVSVTSALAGRPEMALGNAVGSVICNCGLALALCGLFSKRPVPVANHVLRITGGTLLAVALLLFIFVRRDNTLTRGEGLILLAALGVYLGILFAQHRTGRRHDAFPLKDPHPPEPRPLLYHATVFAVALAVIIVASRLIVVSAITIAHRLGIPDATIALTLVALGTSIPEVATSITAAIKGHGELSVGNILGANIMNICWVAGASAVAAPLSLERRETLFIFPSMFILVAVTLFVLHTGHRLSRREGAILLALYIAYLAAFVALFT